MKCSTKGNESGIEERSMHRLWMFGLLNSYHIRLFSTTKKQLADMSNIIQPINVSNNSRLK